MDRHWAYFWIIPERKEGIWLCGFRVSGFEYIREEDDSGRILYDGDETKDMGEESAQDTIIQIVIAPTQCDRVSCWQSPQEWQIGNESNHQQRFS